MHTQSESLNVVDQTYDEYAEEPFVETPEYKAWVQEVIHEVDVEPSRSYTYEELLGMARSRAGTSK